MGLSEVNVEDGSFATVSTYEYGDGVIQGDLKVTAMAMDERNQILDAIPEVYRSEETTPLKLNTADEPLELLIPKP